MGRMSEIQVSVNYDREAGVWYVEASDLPGLNAEAQTIEALQAQIELAVIDLVAEAGGSGDFEVPIALIAHSVARSRDAASA